MITFKQQLQLTVKVLLLFLVLRVMGFAENCYITNQSIPVSIAGCTFTGNSIPGGSTSYVQISNSLQASSTFYVSSGTIASSLSLPFLTPGQCTTTDATGLIINTACGTGGGGSSGPISLSTGIITPAIFTSSVTIKSSMTITGIGGLAVAFGVSAGSYTGAGLGTCGSTSQAESYTSTGTFACTTITPAGIGALTGNQNITVSGDSSGSGTTAITLTAAAIQGNITTFTSPTTHTSSVTVTSPAGASITFGVAVGSVTASSITASGQITGTSGVFNTSLSVAGQNVCRADGTNCPAAGIGDMILASTQTVTGEKIFQSSTVYQGGVNVSSTILLSGSPGSNGQVLTTGGNGTVPTWATPSAGAGGGITWPSTFTLVSNFGIAAATAAVTFNVNVGSITGAGLGTCGSSSQAESFTSSNTFACTTITAAGIGALTGNQTVTLTGDVSGSGATSIATTANALQNNITTFGSSITITGVKGSSTTYGAYVGSATVQDLTASQFVVTDTNKKLSSSLSGATLTSLTGANIASSIPSAVLPSTIDFITSSQTVSAYKNWTSSVAFGGSVTVSSTVLLSGTPGTNGQFLTTGGNGAVPTWTSGNVGTITGVQGGPGLTGGGTSGSVTLQSASTAAFTTSSNTWTAYQNFTSSITEAGGIYISSTVLLSGSPGTNGQVLATGGNGTVPTWITPSAGGGIVSPATFTWVNNFGIQASTLQAINATGPTTLIISTSATGISQLAVSSAIAVNPTDNIISFSSSTGTTILWIDNAGNLISSGTTTTVSNCGAAPAGTIAGNNIAGQITVGGGVVTACTVNFANGGYVNAPICTFSDNSTTVNPSLGATSGTAVTINLSATLGGGLLNYICVGYQK